MTQTLSLFTRIDLIVLIVCIPIFFSNFVVPNLVLPGLAGINAQYVIPTSSSQLEELLKHGYPPQLILQQFQLAQVCSYTMEYICPFFVIFKVSLTQECS